VQRLALRNDIDMECLKTYRGVKRITMKLQIPRHGQRHHRAGGGAYDEPGVWDGSTLSFVISLSSTNFVQLGLWNERLSAARWITRHLGKAACHQLQSLAKDPCAPVSGLLWLCFFS
jgi:hypothetical protein